jgi:hypothetical protein
VTLHNRFTSAIYLNDEDACKLAMALVELLSRYKAAISTMTINLSFTVINCPGPMDLTRQYMDVMYLHNNIKHCPYNLIKQSIIGDAYHIKYCKDSWTLHGSPFMTMIGLLMWAKDADGSLRCELKVPIKNVFNQLTDPGCVQQSWLSFTQIIKLIKFIRKAYHAPNTAQQTPFTLQSIALTPGWPVWNFIFRDVDLLASSVQLSELDTTLLKVPAVVMNPTSLAITGTMGRFSHLSNRPANDPVCLDELSLI